MGRPTGTLIKVLLLGVLAFSLFGSGQTPNQDGPWKPLMFMIGDWQGQGGGEPGQGRYERHYRFIFDRKFIEVRNKSTYPPSKDNPKGEVHEDLGYISYDKARKTFVLRQFHIEGFVNQYKLTSVSPDGARLVFDSEAIENIASGWRARETYEKLGDGDFRETFELAAPGQDFKPYSAVVLKRTK